MHDNSFSNTWEKGEIYRQETSQTVIFFFFHHVYSNKECLGACVSKHSHPYRESYWFYSETAFQLQQNKSLSSVEVPFVFQRQNFQE